MSKSLHNIIGLTDEPNEMFGKTMSIPDHLLLEFLNLTTDFSLEEKEGIRKRLENENPMNIKKLIAKNIITQYHDRDSAEKAEEFFVNQFQSKNSETKSFTSVMISSLKKDSNEIALIDLCALIKNDITKSANRRLIESGAVQINHEKILNPFELISLQKETKIKIGKRNFYELK